MNIFQPGKRVFIAGKTGSGKTTLAEKIAIQQRNLIVLDTKHQIDLGERYKICTTKDVIKYSYDNNYDGIIIRPSATEIDSSLYFDNIFKWIYERENTQIYIDEILMIVKSHLNYPKYLRALYTQGRSKNIGIMTLSQRPSGIPLWILSETDTFIKFQLQLNKDTMRMSEFMGNTVIEYKDYPIHTIHKNKHSFFMYQPGDTIPEQLIVKVD